MKPQSKNVTKGRDASVLKQLFSGPGAREPRLPRSDGKAARRRRARGRLAAASPPERLEPRLALAISVMGFEGFVEDYFPPTTNGDIGETNIPGRFVIAADGGSDIYIQRVASRPTDLLIADNPSFLNYQVINSINQTSFNAAEFGPQEFWNVEEIFVTNASRRQETIEADGWWLFGPAVEGPQTTRLMFASDSFDSNGGLDTSFSYNDAFQFSPPRDVAGTIRYQQSDGVISEWTFSAFSGGSRGVGVRNIRDLTVVGPGFGSPLPAGYLAPVAVRPAADPGDGNHGSPYLEVVWSGTPITAPEMAISEIYLEGDFSGGVGSFVAVGAGAALNPDVTFSLAGARDSTLDASGTVSLGVVPGTLRGSLSIGSFSSSIQDLGGDLSFDTLRIANTGILAGGRPDGFEGGLFLNVFASGGVDSHNLNINLRASSDTPGYDLDGQPGDRNELLPDTLAGLNGVNIPSNASVSAEVEYLTYTRDPQPTQVVFAAGLDIHNEVTVDLISPGSALDVRSPIRVQVDGGGLDLRASAINVSAALSAPGVFYVGRSQMALPGTPNESRLTFPFLDSPTMSPDRFSVNAGLRQVQPVAVVGTDGTVQQLVVLPGFEGYGYDPDRPPQVVVEGPSAVNASAEVKAVSGSLSTLSITSGGTGYVNGAVVSISDPEFARVVSLVPTGGNSAGRYLIDDGAGGSRLPARPPIVVVEEPTLVADPTRIGFGQRATAEASFETVVAAATVTAAGGGYTVAPLVTIAPPAAGGIPATARATISGGRVVGIQILNPGSGYDVANPPIVTIERAAGDTTGAGASAAVTLAQGGIRATVVSGGLNYESSPSVTVHTFFESTVAEPDVGNRRITLSETFRDADFLAIGMPVDINGVSVGTIASVNADGRSFVVTEDIAAVTPDASVIVFVHDDYRNDYNRAGGPRIVPAVLGSILGKDPATASALVSNGVVTGLIVTHPGSGYQQPPTVTISPQAFLGPNNSIVLDGEGAAATAAIQGGIAEVIVGNAGTNYLGGENGSLVPVSVTGAGGTGGSVTFEVEEGRITGGRVVNQGSRYRSAADAAIRLPAPPPMTAGEVAEFVAIVDADGGVRRFSQVRSGSGYAVPPRVSVEGPLVREDASASSVLNAAAGAVDRIVIDQAGLGFQSPPTVVIDAPSLGAGGRQARAQAVLDNIGRIARIDITDPGAGYRVRPAVRIVGHEAPSYVETVSIDAAVSASIYEWYVGDNRNTLSPTRGTVRLAPQTILGGGAGAANAVFMELYAADLIAEGAIWAGEQTYLLGSPESSSHLAPFVFTTRSPVTGEQTGLIRGATVTVTLGNDTPTPLSSGVDMNVVDLRTQIDSLRITAADSIANPRGSFPYAITISELDNVSIDAVASTFGSIDLSSGGAMTFNAALSTDGDVKIEASQFAVTSPLSTRFGTIGIKAESISIANSLAVTQAAVDDTLNDIELFATSGELFLQGAISAVNNVLLRQEGPGRGIFGPSRVEAQAISVRAAGSVDVRTEAVSLSGFSGGDFAVAELDDINIPLLTAPGVVSLTADGNDRGAYAPNPIALTARLVDVSRLEVSTPKGSAEVFTDSAAGLVLGNPAAIRNEEATPMAAGGSVTIRTVAGDVAVFDAPVAAGNAIAVKAATVIPLPGAYTYLPGQAGRFASTLSGVGSLNSDAYREAFDRAVSDSNDVLRVGDLVLVKNQADRPDTTGVNEARENGVYVVTRLGGGVDGYSNWLLTRAPSADSSADAASGTYVRVTAGATLARSVFQMVFAESLDLSVSRTENNQIVLPSGFGPLGDLRPGQAVVGPNIAPSAVVTQVDHENGVVTLGLRQHADAASVTGSTLSLPSNPLLLQQIVQALADGQKVLITGEGLRVGAEVTGVSGSTLSLKAGDIERSDLVSRVVVGFASKTYASNRITLNPAVRSHLASSGQVIESTSSSVTLDTSRFTNWDSLFVGQPVYGDGVLPGTVITGIDVATKTLNVTPGGIPTAVPAVQRVEGRSTVQTVRELSGVAAAAPDVVAIELADAVIDFTRIRVGESTISGAGINGTKVVMGVNRVEKKLYFAAGAVTEGDLVDQVSVRYTTAGNTVVGSAASAGEDLAFDYVVLPQGTLAALGDSVTGPGIANDSSVVGVVEVDTLQEPVGTPVQLERIALLTPGALRNPGAPDFGDVSIGNRTAVEALESGRFAGRFDFVVDGENVIDLAAVADTFTQFDAVQVGMAVRGLGISVNAEVLGIDFANRVISLSPGAIADPSVVNQVTFQSPVRTIEGSFAAVSSGFLVSGRDGLFNADRITLGAGFSGWSGLVLGDTVTVGAKTGTITGFDRATRLIGLSAGTVQNTEPGDSIQLSEGIKVVASTNPSNFHLEGFEEFLEMPSAFEEYDLLHLGQRVGGPGLSADASITGIDAYTRRIGLKPGSIATIADVDRVTFLPVSEVQFGVVSGQGTSRVMFVGPEFGFDAINVLAPTVASANAGQVVGFTDSLELEAGFDRWDLLEQGMSVTGVGLPVGAKLTSWDPGSSTIKLDTNLLGSFTLLPTNRTALRFHSTAPDVRTNIGTDAVSGIVDFVISTGGATNSSLGSLGKMISLRQKNDTSEAIFNPDQKMDIRFWDSGPGTITLTQQLPEIAKPFALDGSRLYTLPGEAANGNFRVAIDGTFITTGRDDARLAGGSFVSGLEFVAGSDGASVRNLTIGNFSSGAAVYVNNASNLLVDGLTVGLNPRGERATNEYGVLVRGEKAQYNSIINSTLVAGSRAAIRIDGGAAENRIVNNTVTTSSVSNVVGIELASGNNSVGVNPLPPSQTVTATGARVTNGSPVITLPSGFDFSSVYPGLYVSIVTGGGVPVFNTTTTLRAEQNIVKVVGVDTAAGTVTVDKPAVVSANGPQSVDLIVGHLAKGDFGSTVLELPGSVNVADLFNGQRITGDGIPAGTAITRIIPRATAAEPDKVEISSALNAVGLNRTRYRRVLFETGGRNNVTYNRTGIDIGLYSTFSGTVPQIGSSQQITISSQFVGWQSVRVGASVTGDGIQSGTKIASFDQKNRRVVLDKPLTRTVTNGAVMFGGADGNRVTNTLVDGNLQSGIRVGGGAGHVIGSPSASLVMAATGTAGSSYAVTSYATGVTLSATSTTLAMPTTYAARGSTVASGQGVRPGMRVYGEGIADGTTVVSVAVNSGDNNRVVSVTLSRAPTRAGASTISFGLGVFVTPSSADLGLLRVGQDVSSATGMVDYTKITAMKTPASGGLGVLTLATPNRVLAVAYPNSDFGLVAGEGLVVASRGSASNVFVGNGRYGVEATAAAFATFGSGWSIAGNFFGVNASNTERLNVLGPIEVNPGSSDDLGIPRGFDKADQYANQYGAAIPPSETVDPVAPPDPGDEPPDGPDDPITTPPPGTQPPIDPDPIVSW